MTATPPVDDRASLAPGAVVGGKYRLRRRLGAGGMGEVWVAENRDTGASIAVKMMRRAAARGDAARFRQEARLAATLGHRGVVRIFDLVEDTPETLVLVMELLRGETLERHLARRGPLPLEDAIAITIPLLAALAHAHDAGIVHRDVTPANVFLALDPDGHVTPKLLDFGLAKVPAASESHTVDGHALGTPRYMAPERIRDHEGIDGRTDLFSVGVIVYELLTGVCPFAASSPAASLAAVIDGVVDPDPRIPPRLWLELRRALAKRPYERHANASAMASGLLAACGESEASLNDALRRLPLSPSEAQDGAASLPSTRTPSGVSPRATPANTFQRHRVALWVAGAFVGLGLLVGLAMKDHLRRPFSTAPTATAGDTAASPATPTLDAAPLLAPSSTAAAPAAPRTPLSASPSAPPTSSAPRVAPRPAHTTARPKPVAVTPGF